MLTLEQLRVLRGTSSSVANKSAGTETGVLPDSVSDKNEPSMPQQVIEQPQVQQSQNRYPEPVKIPCKNYVDEQGHFFYIDANTHQISHVNLDTGQIYTFEDVYRLSLSHAVASLSDEYQNLTWQQVLSENTVFDRFGSPLFTFEEVYNAKEKSRQTIAPKTDPFGLPL